MSIVTFTLPSLYYKCAKYGTLQSLLNTSQGKPSTIGTPQGRKEDTAIRKSKHYSCKIDFKTDIDLVLQNLRQLVPDEREHEVQWFKKSHTYDVIEYTVGGFFAEHQDKQKSESHYGTLLIFPPAIGEFTHTGGYLIIREPSGKPFIFDSSHNMEWTFVAFHTELKHECTEVLSGKRVVIKTELEYAYGPPVEPYDYIPDIVD